MSFQIGRTVISAACKLIEVDRANKLKPYVQENILMDVSKNSTPPVASGIKIQSMRIQQSYFEVEKRQGVPRNQSLC